MGNSHKVSHQDQTSSQIIKKKQQLQFMQTGYIRQFETGIEQHYQILSPPLVNNNFYQLRKTINKRTKLSKAAFIINKYKVRTQQRELLQQQINKLKRIDNPYLLKIYELYYDQHRFYIICQFCYGQSLAQILIEEGSVPERKAAKIMYQLLSVLAECHRNNVIHSDLKLQNITFNSKDQQVIKITDFSISRIFRIQDTVEQTRRKAFLLAPEMLKGEPVTKSDVWSCGMIMYIILSGHIPIYGSTVNRLKQKMSYYEPNFNIQKFKFISKQGKSLIKHMLTENFNQRPSAEQCLTHSWFKKYYKPTKIDDSTLKQVLSEGFNFNPSSKLQEATWGLYVNAFISFDQKQSILHVFALLDEGSKNHLTKEDLKRGFLMFYDEEKANFYANHIYKYNKQKPIKFSQLVTICTNRDFLINSENNQNLFEIFDDDGSGQISVSELKAVLGASKEITQQIWIELMKEADENSDGVISYDQFTHMMKELLNKNNANLLQQIKA